MPADVIFIESNTSGTGRLFARWARALGYRPVLLTGAPARYAYAAADRIETRVLDTSDEAALLHACGELHARQGVAGVTTSSDYYVATAAMVAAALGLPGPDPDALRAVRDKETQRRRLAAAGVPVPAARGASSVAEAREAAMALGLPVVVKPVMGSGSNGVRLCASPEEVAAHAGALLAREHNERGLPVPRRILVESLATGQEYSVEILSRAIAGVTRKHLGAPPCFVESGHDYPAPIPDPLAASLGEVARAAVDALGLSWGPAHVELRATEDGPRIIEVNPRLAGGFIPELVRHASGIDLIEQTMRLVTGQPVTLAPVARRHAAIRFFMAPATGTLAGVDGLEAARATRDVAEVQVYPALGARVALHGDFRDRAGHVLACADSPAAAQRAAETSLSHLRLRVTSSK